MSTPRVDMSQVRCGTGTYLEKMNDAIRFTEEKRARVVELSRDISDAITIELITRHRQLRKPPPTPAHLAAAVDKAVEDDARWRSAVGDEQWGYRLTTMYGTAELVSATRENTQVLKAIFEELHEANALAKTVVMVTRQHEDLLKTQIIDQRRLLTEQRTTNELLTMLVGQLSVPAEHPNPPAPPQRLGD